MLFASTLLVAMDRITAEDGAKRVNYALVKGRRVIKTGSCVLDELNTLGGSSIRACVASPLCHLERITLDVANAKLANFSARRFIDAESFFTEPYRVRSRVLSLQARRADTVVVAMTEDDLQMAVEALPSKKRPIEALVPAELAIAAAVGKVSDERHLIFWARGESFLAFVAERGRVLWRRMDRVNRSNDDIEHPELRWLKYEGLVDMAESNLDQTMRRSIASFLMLGELQGMPLEGEAALNEPVRRQVETRLGDFYKGKVNAVAWPELLGLPFVDGMLSMMDEEYSHQALAWRIATPAAAFAMLAGVGFAAHGMVEQHTADALQKEVAQRSLQLEQGRDALRERVPSQAILAQLDADLRVAADARNVMRVDYFLEWLSESIVGHASVQRVDLNQAGQGRTRTARRGTTTTTANSDYDVNVEVQIRGDYDEAKEHAETLVRRWSQRVNLRDNTFLWDPVTSVASLSTRMGVKTSEF